MSQSELTADFRISRKFWFLVPISKGGNARFAPPADAHGQTLTISSFLHILYMR